MRELVCSTFLTRDTCSLFDSERWPWVRNYLEFRSKHTLGLSVFAALLLAENLLTFNYYVINTQVANYLSDADPIAGKAMMFVQVLEFAAIAFLLWTTWD